MMRGMQTDPWQTHVLEAGHDPLTLLEREWLLTNGTGAFAAGTAVGCPTRRYHGLLIAAAHPPVGRVVALNQMWEQLVLHRPGEISTQPLTFNTLMFRGEEGHTVFAPRGFELLQRFERGLSVRWLYKWGELQFERELLLHWHEQAATLRYRVQGLDRVGCRATLQLSPMLTLRDFHALRRADVQLDYKESDHVLRVYHDDLCVSLAVYPDDPPAIATATATASAKKTPSAAPPSPHPMMFTSKPIHTGGMACITRSKPSAARMTLKIISCPAL